MVIDSLYGLGLRLRHHAYDKGWLSQETPGLCTVSVGNIAVGGSGKTPIVQKLAKELSPNHKVAISLRGYRGAAEHGVTPILVTADTSPAVCGDEALLHAISLPSVAVFAGKHRVKASFQARQAGAEVLLLDDGMQHRRLKRDIEIAVVDGQDDLEKQHLLPFGRLRDLPERLRGADAVILHHATENWREAASKLKKFTDAPIIPTSMQPSKETRVALKGKNLAYFCALGRPERFAATLQSLGCTILDNMHLRDHAAIEPKKLFSFCADAKAKGAEVLVCTAKDFIKLSEDLSFLPLPVHVVQAEVDLLGEKESWDHLLDSIVTNIQQRRGLCKP